MTFCPSVFEGVDFDFLKEVPKCSDSTAWTVMLPRFFNIPYLTLSQSVFVKKIIILMFITLFKLPLKYKVKKIIKPDYYSKTPAPYRVHQTPTYLSEKQSLFTLLPNSQFRANRPNPPLPPQINQTPVSRTCDHPSAPFSHYPLITIYAHQLYTCTPPAYQKSKPI